MREKKVHIVLVFFCFWSCIETFEAETQTFEDVLVVDARLTDELKKHQIKLSRTRPFEAEFSDVEKNATVTIIEDSSIFYNFIEIAEGVYESVNEFAAKKNSSYELQVNTSDGRSYQSASVTTPDNVPIYDLYFERNTNDLDEEGVSVLLDNTSQGETKFFRYEYDETFKIIAPTYSGFKFILEEQGYFNNYRVVRIRNRTENVRTCYRTDKSTNVTLFNTERLNANNVSRFKVRFINRNNYIISHRYSILVKQYTMTRDAHAYYSKLNDFSSSDNVFSEIQPGFIEGNIKSMSSDTGKVLGYFEVSAFNGKRIYFNYKDLFPDEPLPPYIVNCSVNGKPYTGKATRIVFEDENIFLGPSDVLILSDSTAGTDLTQGIKAGSFTYWALNEEFVDSDRASANGFSVIPPFVTKFRPCGDCTVLGSTEKPDFWID